MSSELHPETPAGTRPRVLVLGATGQTGRLIVQQLAHRTEVDLRVTARTPADLERLRAGGLDAVLLDLDQPLTFATALAAVDRLYLVTAYTVDMLVQGKTMIDAAVKAGVSHVVHQGVFANWDVTDPHFTWHQLIETYIEASGIGWTHLHPNFYMENFNAMKLTGGRFTVHWGNARVGWIAGRDVAKVAARVLLEGPTRHGGKNYWLSTEALSGPEAAATMSEVLGQEVRCDVRSPDEMSGTPISAGGTPMEAKYAEGAAEFVRQVADGRMGYIGTVRDDVPYVTGEPATTLREWFEDHRGMLLDAISAP